MARAIGGDTAALEATVKAYNEAAVGYRADLHGHTNFGMVPLLGLFWYTRVLPALLIAPAR